MKILKLRSILKNSKSTEKPLIYIYFPAISSIEIQTESKNVFLSAGIYTCRFHLIQNIRKMENRGG